MAHIEEFKIDGLLGREGAVRVKLQRGVNIFFGENGSGKTTLLKILDAAMSGDSAVMRDLPLEKAEVVLFSIAEDKYFKHVWDRKDLSKKSAAEKHLSLLQQELLLSYDEGATFASGIGHRTDWKISPTPKGQGSKGWQGWAHTFLPTTRLYFVEGRRPGSGRNRTELSERELDQAFADAVNRAWLRFYSRTLDAVRQIQEGGLRTVLRHVLSPDVDRPFDESTDVADVYHRVDKFLARQSRGTRDISLGSLAAFKKRYREDANLRRIVDNLEDVERSIEGAMAKVDNFLSTVSSLFSRKKSLLLLNNELQVVLSNRQTLPIASLSSGEKHLIRILLSCMDAGPNTVFIDEPELSMHIDWQRVFVKTIQSLNPECQLILASHAPEIMAEVPDESIFKL